MLPVIIIFSIMGLIAFLIVFSVIIPIPNWIQAISSGVKISVFALVGMRLRRVPPRIMVDSLIKSQKAGINVTSNELETHYLAGGDINNVINALIAADKADIKLSFDQATAIDLAGRDVFEAVRISVVPKVIETPLVVAMAKDGIQVKAFARITVRANLSRLVGGAGVDTILARVGEGIVTTIGSSETHKKVLENPDIISQGVLSRGLDTGTAYDILSIDIADVDVGKNIGAELQIDQAEADKKIAQAKAEERRAMAVAREQEMKAKITEMKAQLVEAEAKVPQALAQAFRANKIKFSTN